MPRTCKILTARGPPEDPYIDHVVYEGLPLGVHLVNCSSVYL